MSRSASHFTVLAASVLVPLAAGIVEWTRGSSPFWLLSGFFALTVLLTQPMSNQAAAIVVKGSRFMMMERVVAALSEGAAHAA